MSKETKNQVYDTYYSEKCEEMCLRMASQGAVGHKTAASMFKTIDGKTVRVTYRCLKGRKPVPTWDDLTFVGHTKDSGYLGVAT